MTARTTHDCGLPLVDGHCPPCRASAKRARRFRGWIGWLRSKPAAEGTWVVRGRVIRHVDPMAPDEVDAPAMALLGRLASRVGL